MEVRTIWTNRFRISDLQNVNITLRVLFRPIHSALPNIYTNLGQDYDERVLPSITNEVLKAVVVRRVVFCLFADFSALRRLPHHYISTHFDVCGSCWFQAQFDAGELITQRELVSQRVNEELKERATTFGIILDDISLVSGVHTQFFRFSLCS